MIKATQPAHRCLSHLILLIIRTIERHGAVEGTADLQLSKKEIKKFDAIAKQSGE